MLEEKDLQAIKTLLQDNNKSIKKEMQDNNKALKKEMQDNNKALKKEMRKCIVESEKMLLGEMDRMKGFIDVRFEKLEDAVQELTRQYKLTQPDRENLSFLLQSIVNMQKEIEEIKEQIA